MFLLTIILLSPLLSAKLLMVIEISRHGAREPIYDILKFNPFDSQGELTPVGMKQHYLLGQTLRTLYIENENLFSSIYSPKDIYIRSTNYNRTIQSAYSQLFGLFPLGSGPNVETKIPQKYLNPPFETNITDFNTFSRNLHTSLGDQALLKNFQPIPVHVIDLDHDYLLRPFDIKVCPINIKLQNIQYESKIFKDLTNLFKDNTLKELPNHSLWDAFDLYDTYENFRYSNQTFPSTFTPELKRNLTFIHNIMIYLVYFGSEEQRRFLNTPIIDEILKYFDRKINKTDEIKFVYYSGHDRTISMILSGLNYSSVNCSYNKYMGIVNKISEVCLEFPHYASNILIELHENDENNFNVKIRYDGNYIPMCGTNLTFCKYETFAKKLKEYRVSDFEKYCQINSDIADKTVEKEEEYNKKQSNSTAKIFSLFFGFIFGVTITGIIFYYKFIKKERENQDQELGLI